MVHWDSLNNSYNTMTVNMDISSATSNKHMGRHSFVDVIPTELNKLPQAVRSQDSINGFRKQLRTYLFRLTYPPYCTITWIWTILQKSDNMDMDYSSEILLGHHHLRGCFHQFGAIYMLHTTTINN